jgi:hypothetical protein
MAVAMTKRAIQELKIVPVVTPEVANQIVAFYDGVSLPILPHR